MSPKSMFCLSAALCCLALLLNPAHGDDWPMSRYDAQRSSAGKQQLAEKLYLNWVREYPRLQTAWPDQPKLVFDRAYDPVVLGTTLFVGSACHDTLTALDTRTGDVKWTFHADGPVRLAAAAWEGKVYFASDDGYLYCLDAGAGRQLWKFRGGPSERNILGNGRLISTWPARGGPVLADGIVYFAAGVWPFMGIFLHALDARTGAVVWTNDGDGSIYIAQPHNAPAFGGVAPQGNLAVAGDRLLVPGGRSVPACYDRKTGKLLYYQLAANGKRGGGSDVAVHDKVWFNGGAAYDLLIGEYLGPSARNLILGDTVIGHAGSTFTAFDLKNTNIDYKQEVDRKGIKAWRARWKIAEPISAKAPPAECLIQAGSRLYLGNAKQVEALELPLANNKEPKVSWRAEVEGTPVRLVAADERLFAVILEGRIYCFGPEKIEPKTHRWETQTPAPADAAAARARTLLDAAKVREGYCVIWGIGDGQLVIELARHGSLHIVVVDPDADKVAALRKRMIAAGLYGERVAVHAGEPRTFPLPPYLASMMVAENADAFLDSEALKNAYAALRPYGGSFCLKLPAEKRAEFGRRVPEAGLAQAQTRAAGDWTVLERVGPLPGAADWTHEHADAANTRVSLDQRVKAPLGILWFGGSSNQGILPRHGHGPQPQVLDGRAFVEGVDMMRALDIYTGRVLWETRLPGVGKFFNNYVHQSGANATGTNFISTADGIYVLHDSACVRLDPATGEKRAELKIPAALEAASSSSWCYLNVSGDYLVCGYNPAPAKLKKEPFRERLQIWDPATQKITANLEGHADDVLAVAFAPSGKLLATAGEDRSVRLWDPAAKKQLAVLEQHSAAVTCLVFSPDGTVLASGGKDRTVCLWDSATHALKATLKGHNESVSCLAFARDGKTLASADLEADVILWDAGSGRKRDSIDGNIEDVTALAFTADGQSLIAGTSDGHVHLIDLATKGAHTLEGHKGLIQTAAGSPDGQTLAIGNRDRSVKVFDVASGKIIGTFSSSSAITGLAFAGDGKSLAVSDEEGGVQFWNLAGPKADRVFQGTAGAIRAFALAPDGKSLATAAADKHAPASFAASVASKILVVMNRQTGKILWNVSAEQGFRHNAVCIGGGRLYAIDRASPNVLSYLTRRGQAPQGEFRILAFDLRTGQRIWSNPPASPPSQGGDTGGVFGTWLSYSAKHDILIEASRKARDTLYDEPRGMRAFKAVTGAVLWKNETYRGPAILHGDTILHETGGCELATGKPTTRLDPISGDTVEWYWTRGYGCNTPLASEHLMTFRSGAAGFCDLANDGGTGNFGGFRSGCTNNLIVAGGLLVAPDYTRTCTCSYQNQTSLALVPMPEAEIWTVFPRLPPSTSKKPPKPPNPADWHKNPKPVKHLALNLGAPGSRRADDGRFWFNGYEHAHIQFDKNFGYYNGHSSKIVATGGVPPWVVASGCRGIEQLEVALLAKAKTGDRYTVRLYFADPDNDQVGQRVFGVAVQDKPVLDAFDVVKEAGGRNRPVVKEFKGIVVKDRLVVRFSQPQANPATPASVPLLCGMEMVREGE